MKDKRKQRVLWLINHSTLIDFEVPLLINLGMEVFVPKRTPQDEANLSTTITYKYDDTLSIPPKLLDKMNKLNFYSNTDQRLILSEINRHFGVAICAFFPQMINNLCTAFRGDILMRAFGREGNGTYAEILEANCDERTIARIRHKKNIFFAPAYPNIPLNEPSWLQDISVILPLGLPQAYLENENSWRGRNGKILFICPRINTSHYYWEIYNNFRLFFGDLPHLIVGNQPVAVENDKNVTGYINEEQYNTLKIACDVMFYSSREPRHLHYHPLEAIALGMPLIFMSGGMLHYIAKTKLPGCCDSFNEARHKIISILNGNQDLIESVRDSQKILLQSFTFEFAKTAWSSTFIPIVERTTFFSNLLYLISGSMGIFRNR
jgi:hypothetical protein